MPCEYGPAAAGALSVAINSCALTVVEIFCFFICFLAADSTHKLRAVMDDAWYACMISCLDNKWRIGHVSVVFVSSGAQMSRMCERDNKKPENKRTATNRVFLPSRGRRSAMIIIIRFSFTHTHARTHTQRE